MGFLNPLFLIAGASVLVPIILHLFYRQESKSFTFPAIRYLLKTEREHARQIRTQQLLLLLLRVAALVLLVLLGARIHFPGPGGSHEPTALALVIDNSLSTTMIDDGRRRLDDLKDVARQSVSGAGGDDLIWVIPAASPWVVAVPSRAGEALRFIDEIEPSHAAGHLTGAIERARALVGQSPLPAREIHLFTDLQATEFDVPAGEGVEASVVVFASRASAEQNRSIRGVTIGGGLPPLAGRRTEAAVSITGGTPGDTVGVRLYIGDQVRAATAAPVGTTVQMSVGPFGRGLVEGHAEIDPDPLTADDRFYFSFTVRDPTGVALVGAASFFVSEALAVLEEDGRVSIGGVGRAGTLISAGGGGLDRRDPSQTAVVYPVDDVAQLPALNRQLTEAGIPYRYEAPGASGARIASNDLPVDLADVEVARFYRLVAVGNGQGQATAVATLSTGDPWVVEGTGPLGPYVLLASPLDEASTTLPVSASMIPLLEWAIDRWTAGGPPVAGVTAGNSFRPPPTTSAVQDPTGTKHSVDGDQPFLETSAAGFYRALVGDSVIETIPVNIPVLEADLTPASGRELRAAIPGLSSVVDDSDDWMGNIFRAGRGPEPWQLLIAILLILLTVESVLAASQGLTDSSRAHSVPERSEALEPVLQRAGE